MKRYFLLIVLLLSNIPLLLADDPGTPCGGTSSPDDPVDCPLDTWVIAFAVFMLIMTTLYLYKKQQNGAKLSNN
jgi:hypothetical protein